MENTLVFIDAGFLSKLSKHLGGGKYVKHNLFKGFIKKTKFIL